MQPVTQNVGEPDDGRHEREADTQAGKAFGVSREYVRQARSLTDELTGEVRAGNMTLAEGDRWKRVGPGYEDVNGLMATVRLPNGAGPEQRAGIAQRIKALQPGASQRKIAGVLGVSHTQVQRDLDDGTKVPTAAEESSNGAAAEPETGTKVPPTTEPTESPEQKEPTSLADEVKAGRLTMAEAAEREALRFPSATIPGLRNASRSRS